MLQSIYNIGFETGNTLCQKALRLYLYYNFDVTFVL
jgi:hypothetical protein